MNKQALSTHGTVVTEPVTLQRDGSHTYYLNNNNMRIRFIHNYYNTSYTEARNKYKRIKVVPSKKIYSTTAACCCPVMAR